MLEFLVVKKSVKIHENEEYITLNVLLKITDVISTGGMAKVFLAENIVLVNNMEETRRGRKLYRGDQIQIGNSLFTIE